MIVLWCGEGNHSNRLLQHWRLSAFAVEHRRTFANPSLGSLRRLLSGRVPGPKTLRENMLPKLARRWARGQGHFSDPAQSELYASWLSSRRAPLVLVSGWGLIVPELLAKHRSEVLARVRLPELSPAAEALVARPTAGGALLGLHIRRGDYREWLGGAHFYSDSEYLQAVQAVKRALGRALTVVVFSNEPLDEASFTAPEVEFRFSQAEYWEDYQLMGRCDYLVGPPSTFTMVASFLSGVPLHHLRRENLNPTLDDFHPFLGDHRVLEPRN